MNKNEVKNNKKPNVYETKNLRPKRLDSSILDRMGKKDNPKKTPQQKRLSLKELEQQEFTITKWGIGLSLSPSAVASGVRRNVV